MTTQTKCTNRIPDHTDSWPCERPVLRADRCAECLPGEVRCVRRQLAEAEAKVAELRARLADLEGPPDPEAAPTVETLAGLLAQLPGGVWSWERNHRVADERMDSWTLYVNRGEPITDRLPRGHICNQQHGLNILGGADFDVHGAVLRAFIVAARAVLPALLAESRLADLPDTAAPSSERRNATWWRDKAAQAERLLAQIAQAAGEPIASHYDWLPARIQAASHALAVAGIPQGPLTSRVRELADRKDYWTRAWEELSASRTAVDWDDLDVEDDVLLAEVARRGLAVTGAGDDR